ncbi:MAG: bi-domain-containing oxidoreductase [Acidobacteria bacterium]|uniref:Bi-domain-containing oxidoreductase n=1 Tax=Candidatus Polarisedimenticola svalbardensis TaxID=2886004 RepID=A0A8J6Y2V1_9BACT|nr:bi-domain-containing oxidoreductase [Candidatus Polarisedimenticola svalbardensis]
MKQILQNLSNGETSLVDVPSPKNLPGHVLIASRRTLVSAGTERMLVDFGKAGWIEKARQQPDKVRMVINKVKTDGLAPTVEAVRSKLDLPLPMGYCNVGTVLESGAPGFAAGDLVVSNGNHAEVVRVPGNLVARVPDGVTEDSAVFAVLGAIGLQGIRLLRPTLGENVVVTGLGLIGLLCVQLLRANGCRVLGIDPDPGRCELAAGFGAEVVNLSSGQDPLAAAERFSRGNGVDGVLITASTKSNDPVHQAANMCRKRGRIVLVGVVGLNLSRDDFYKKELSFQVSASYGPGRYDPEYEEKGRDYPIGFVRWTEQRNFEAVLDMMASGALDTTPLISSRYPIDKGAEAYAGLNRPGTLGIVIDYPERSREIGAGERSVALQPAREGGSTKGEPRVAFLGAGNYGSRVLMPAFRKHGAVLETVVSSSGVSGVHHGRKSGFSKAVSDEGLVWADENINTVVIATRHNLHAEQVEQALQAGKHVFVEKPLAISAEELGRIRNARSTPGTGILMVGFNRRFAPHIRKMKELLDNRSAPAGFIMTVNAGEIPAEHWTQDRRIGGGRIVGEACHFIDLMRHLAGSPIQSWQAIGMGDSGSGGIRDDKASITLSFKDGSFGTVHYLANGDKSFPKERIELFCNGGILQLDNFRCLTGFGWPGFKRMKLRTQDKGQDAAVAAFLDAVRSGGPAPIPFEEIDEVSGITIAIADSLVATAQ